MRAPARIGCRAILILCVAVPATRAEPIQSPPLVVPGTLVPELSRGSGEPSQFAELTSALENFRKRDYDRALKDLESARKKDASLPPARLALARAFLATNQLAAGRAALEVAAVEEPAYPGVYVAFGQLALLEGRRTDALIHFEKVAALARTSAIPDEMKRYFLGQAHAGVASVAEARKDWAGAQAALVAQLEVDGKNGLARQSLGRVLFALGKAEQAFAELRQAVKNDPALPPAAISMGWLWTRHGDTTKAAQCMESAVKEEPQNARAHAGYAEWLLEQERAPEAKAEVEAAARLDPKVADLKMVRGLIAWQLRDYPEAEHCFTELHESSPSDFAASNYLALALAEQKDDAKRQRALQLAELNARLYPASGDALGTLAWVYDHFGRTSDAAQVARVARSRATGSSDTAYYLARILADPNRPEDVQRLLKSALEAPGRFTYRKEAREWLERLAQKR
jgi:tetratricopeptide (TPR) repeat protein